MNSIIWFIVISLILVFLSFYIVDFILFLKNSNNKIIYKKETELLKKLDFLIKNKDLK